MTGLPGSDANLPSESARPRREAGGDGIRPDPATHGWDPRGEPAWPVAMGGPAGVEGQGLGRRRFVAAAVAGAALAAPRPLRTLMAADRPWIPDAAFLDDLPRLMDMASVPGLAVSVVHDGAVHWTHAIGVTNATTGGAVTADTVFPAASLGKPVFAAVVLGLARAGRLALDRPLVEYVRPADLPVDPRLDRITARHVLSHTTGLRNWRNRVDQPLAPDFDPGQRFQYSGEGFYWLQRVVEQVTGQAVDRVMHDRLFAPLGLARATYAWSREHAEWTTFGHTNRGAVGTQFTRDLGAKLLPIAEKWAKPMRDWTVADTFRAVAEADSRLPQLPNVMVPNVAGSLLCTAPEYGRFLAAVLGGRPPLSGADRDDMLTPRVTLKPSLSWGLGWGLERRPGGSLFWHWGDNGIFRAFTVGEVATGRALVIFTNAESGPKVYQRLVRAATGLELDALLWV